jgi:hypothetical protein
MQPSLRRWPWWSPVRWRPATVLFGGLLFLSVIAARDAFARGLQWALATFAIGTILASAPGALARQYTRLGLLLFSAGSVIAAFGLVGLFESGLIWQGFVAFLMLLVCVTTSMVVRAVWPMRTMTSDEAQAYVAQVRAWRRSLPHTSETDTAAGAKAPRVLRLTVLWGDRFIAAA